MLQEMKNLHRGRTNAGLVGFMKNYFNFPVLSLLTLNGNMKFVSEIANLMLFDKKAVIFQKFY